MSKTAFVFPGQGSQSLAMLADFADRTPVRQAFQEASGALELDLWELAQNGPEESLSRSPNKDRHLEFTKKRKPIQNSEIVVGGLPESDPWVKRDSITGNLVGTGDLERCSQVLLYFSQNVCAAR